MSRTFIYTSHYTNKIFKKLETLCYVQKFPNFSNTISSNLTHNM